MKKQRQWLTKGKYGEKKEEKEKGGNEKETR